MPVSSVQTGYQMIDYSSRLMKDASQDIAQRSQVNNVNSASKDSSLEFNKVEFHAPDTSLVEPLTQLNQANQYSKIGTNIIQRDQEMLGSLLDIHI